MVDMMNSEITVEDSTNEETLRNRYLTFTLGQETYGLEIKYVTEIIGVQSITEVPDLPEYVKGIINLRGKIIPIMDVRLRLHKPFIPYHDRTCIIVVEIGSVVMGLVVDRVAEVVNMTEDQIDDPPEMNSRNRNLFLKKIGKFNQQVILIMDCEKLLAKDSELN